MKCQLNDCGANALKSGEFCFTHDPASREKHLEAAARGGSASRDLGSVVLDATPLEQLSHIVTLLGETINRVRVIRSDGTMDIRVANCIGFFSWSPYQSHRGGRLRETCD